MSEKIQRPALGQKVRITGVVEMKRVYTEHRNIRRNLWSEQSREANGVYVGYRTVYEGTVQYIGDEEGRAFYPESHEEVWLIVTNARHNPIKCRPHQVIVEAQS